MFVGLNHIWKKLLMSALSKDYQYLKMLPYMVRLVKIGHLIIYNADNVVLKIGQKCHEIIQDLIYHVITVTQNIK